MVGTLYGTFTQNDGFYSNKNTQRFRTKLPFFANIRLHQRLRLDLKVLQLKRLLYKSKAYERAAAF